MRRSLWLAIGLSAGAAIQDSALALFIGLGIALAPWVMLIVRDLVGGFYQWMWKESFIEIQLSTKERYAHNGSKPRTDRPSNP